MIKKIIKILIISLIIAIVLELTIFNIKHYQSFFYGKTIIHNIDQTVSKNKLYSNSVEINLQDDNIIEIQDINRKVNNIFIEGSSEKPSTIKIMLKDEGNDNYYDAGKTYIVDDVKQSKYISIHPMGKLKSIKIIVKTIGDISISKIFLNKNVPIIINNIRIIITFIISYIILYIKTLKPFEKNYKEYISTIVFIIGFLSVFILLFVNVSNYGRYEYDYSKVNQHFQYQILARSLAKGRVTIDLEVSNKLLALKNPYDISVRDGLLSTNDDYYLDYAYYKGKYYSYFGIVPCLFMHLPFYLITHHDLNNVLAISLSCILYVISGFFLTYQLFNRYYPKAKFKQFLVFALSISVLSGISMIIRKGYFYGIPIAFGASLAMLGLGFWLKCLSDDKRINTKYLAIGSILLALVAGCRPQIFLAAFLGIPLFWKYFKNKEIFKVKNILAVVLPMIIIASLLMYYNYIRFDSIFDFGANYNLTSNDMTKRGFYFDRIITGLFAFLFEAPRINLVFPYIHPYTITSNYIGITIYEEMVGGALLLNLLTIINLFVFKIKKIIKQKELFYICLLSIIISIVIIIVDVQIAGILPRYICDFGFLLSFSSIILWMSILNSCKNYKSLMFKIITWIVIIGIVYNFLTFFTDGFIIDGYNAYRKVYLIFYYLFSFGI